jgi:hypothetical protein
MELHELLEAPLYELEGVSALWSLSSNYDYPTPATVFLDLIGFSEEEYGEPLTTMKQAVEVLDWLAISYVADALQEFANRPNDVRVYVQNLLDAEGGE